MTGFTLSLFENVWCGLLNQIVTKKTFLHNFGVQPFCTKSFNPTCDPVF